MSLAGKSTGKGLGRGIDVLLPEDFDRSLLLKESERIQKIPLDQLDPNPDQPRKDFDQKRLAQLSESIKRHGILQPIIVTPGREKDRYIIVAGERRWRAAGMVGLDSMPAIIRTSANIQKLELALVENVQRVNLSPLEQALSLERLHQQFNLTYSTIAKRLGKSTPAVINLVRLLELPEASTKAIQQRLITEGHARAILALKDDENKQDELLKAILRNGWSVRQAERFVIAYKTGAQDSRAAKARVRTESPQTKRLSERLSAPVSVRRMANGGKLEITFKSEEDLQRIVKNLMKK